MKKKNTALPNTTRSTTEHLLLFVLKIKYEKIMEASSKQKDRVALGCPVVQDPAWADVGLPIRAALCSAKRIRGALVSLGVAEAFQKSIKCVTLP